MSFEIGLLFALLAVMVVLFLTEKLPVDLTAFLGLVVLIFAGFVTPEEAFQGFASSAVITMLSVFILGAALLETGVADLIGGQMHRLVGDSENRLIVLLMVVAGVLSAFMNNIAATAVLMPAVATLGPRTGLAPSRLFMPLAFGAILGGTTTLVGTPPNILAAQMMRDRGLEPFELFDFTPLGAAILVLGVVFMLTLGKRLLPHRERDGAGNVERADLGRVYQLEERLFSLHLPEDSALAGRTLAETRLGNTLGVKVVAIEREGRRSADVDGQTRLRGGDTLFVEGESSRVRDFLEMERFEVRTMPAEALPRVATGVDGMVVKVLPGGLAGETVRELALRARFGIVVLAVRHRDQLFVDHLAMQTVRVGDELLLLGLPEDLEGFGEREDVEVLETGLEALEDLQDRLRVIEVEEGSELVGKTIGESRLGEIAGLTVAGIIREGQTRLTISPAEQLEAGDRLLLAAGTKAIEALTAVDVEIGGEFGREILETDETALVEVAVAPRSDAEGKSLDELDFQGKYGLLALSLWREGRPLHADLAHVPLHFGDALLLHGPRDRIRRLAAEPDFVVLSEAAQGTRRKHKAPFALGGLAVMIALVATGWQPIHVASFTAASLVILAGALTMKEAYRVIEWRAIFLVAAVLPVGFAMERTGAADMLADTVAATAGPYGPYAVLAALVVLASMLSQGLDGAPSVVLLAPVVMQMAEQMSISPYPLMMGVSLAASAAFMTPFSHKANLLVMGAGGYKSTDYLRVGTPLTLMLFVLLVLLTPVFFPF